MFAESQSYVVRRTPIAALCERKSTCWSSVITWYTKASKNHLNPTPIGDTNLFSIDGYRSPSRKQLRSFGLLLATGFFIIGIERVVVRHSNPVSWAMVLSLVFLVTGVAVPKLLRPVHRIWMLFGD